MLGQNLSFREKDRLLDLMAKDRYSLKRIFWDLPTPSISEVSGEYDAQLLAQGDRLETALVKRIFSSSGNWIGKAFRPVSETNGEGYNAFGTAEDRSAKLCMDTYIDHSLIVPGHSFILDYRAKNWGPIRWLRGELRPVTPSIFLGMGTFGPRARKLHKLRRVIPFVLVESDRPYLGEEASVVTHEVVNRVSDGEGSAAACATSQRGVPSKVAS